MVKPVYATIVGSKLYGFNTPQSDTDFKGIGFEDKDQIVGLKHFEQQEFKNAVEDGPDKVEGVVYSIRRYLGLCLSGNPTVIEFAFATSNNHLLTTPIGLEVVEFVKQNMLSKHLFKPYSAYHRAQIRKMQSMERTGKRLEIVEKYGYDCKFATHAYRLAKQCCIVMREGVLRPTLDSEDKDICLKLRNGIYTKEQALDLLETIDKDMYVAYNESSLPEQPDFNKANNFVCQLYIKYLNGIYDDQLKNPTVVTLPNTFPKFY